MVSGSKLDKERYLMHRKRVKNAKTLLFTRAQAYTKHLMKLDQAVKDFRTFAQESRKRNALIIRKNRIERISGATNTQMIIRDPPYFQRHYSKLMVITKLEKQNQMIAKRLSRVVARVDSKKPRSLIIKREEVYTYPFKIISDILEKYEKHMVIPRDDPMLEQLSRPKACFQVGVVGGQPLGKFVVEFHTEAAPQVVLEIVNMCAKRENSRLQIINIFPELWIGNHLTLNQDSLALRPLEYDTRAFACDRGYQLVFSKESIGGFRSGHMFFNITFRPVRIVDAKYVIFGEVLKGFRFLSTLKDYGCSNGKMKKKLYISSCGLLAN